MSKTTTNWEFTPITIKSTKRRHLRTTVFSLQVTLHIPSQCCFKATKTSLLHLFSTVVGIQMPPAAASELLFHTGQSCFCFTPRLTPASSPLQRHPTCLYCALLDCHQPGQLSTASLLNPVNLLLFQGSKPSGLSTHSTSCFTYFCLPGLWNQSAPLGLNHSITLCCLFIQWMRN